MRRKLSSQEEEDIEKPVETHLTGKIGAKKLRKLEEKQARKAQREAEEAEREERKRLESQREAEWKKEEERLRLEEEQKEEEERKAQEEQARREHEEYLKLKEAFVVEEEGVGETMTEEQVSPPPLRSLCHKGSLCEAQGLTTSLANTSNWDMRVCVSVNRPLQQEALSSVESDAPRLFTWEDLLLMQGSNRAGTQTGCRQVSREYTHSGGQAWTSVTPP